MRSAATSLATGEHASLPVARLDAQDAPSVLPLREYLETHGVGVFVNKAPSTEVTYHIVMGEGDFVKKIFRTNKTREKRLAIVVGYPSQEYEPKEYQSKVIFVDPKEISKDQVIDIFDFFFTSEKDVLDMRTQRHTRTEHEKTPVESPARDQERIGHIIRDVFGDSAKPSRRRKKKQQTWMIGVLIGLGMIIIPIVWYLISITVSGIALAASARSLSTGNIDSAGWQTNVATYWIKQGSAILKIASVPLKLVGWQELIRGQERLFSFFSDSETSSNEVQFMVGVGQSVASGFLNQVDVASTGTTPAADITKLRRSLNSVQNTLGLAQAQLIVLLKDRTFPFTAGHVAQTGTRIISELMILRDWAANTDKLVSLFLQLAGFKEPRTYLILLQNSTELRPTGGFIGSVAVTTFADGRMTDLQVQDVYTFDGQLKGHVEPPTPVRELLDQEHWYLRDSNWDPDFESSAARAAWFYQKETGMSVDGVFALNTPFIVEILKATGPVDLPDYNERITADNFYGKSLYYTHHDFFPGSTQKKDFLGTLARALITKITTSRTTNMTALFRAVTHALAGHDLLMMFGTQELQSVVSHYGWAGKVPSADGCIGTDSTSCRFDPLLTVEANMGVNKVNYFITRKLDRLVTVHPDGSMTETATVTIKNTSERDRGLSYRMYLRFFLPADGAVVKVTRDGTAIQPRKDTTHTPSLPYLERTDATADSYVLGVGVDIPAASETQLSVTYTRDNVIRFGPSGAVVDLFVQKQPGVTGTPVHTVLRYPAAWTVGLEEHASGAGPQDFIANAGQLEYNTVLDRDILTRVRFTK